MAIAVLALVAAGLSGCVPIDARYPAPSAPGVQSSPAAGPRTPAALQGSSGTFHVRDIDGSTLDLTYGYEPSRTKTRPLDMGGAQMAELQVEARYTLRIANTTPGTSLTFKPNSDWPATFGIYALWESPNALCDKAFGPGPSGRWCGVELAHFHIDQAVAPGASIELTAHPGFSDLYPVDAGTVVPHPSELLAVRDALARPHDFMITYQGLDGWRFIGSCRSDYSAPSPSPEMRKQGFSDPVQIASRSGTCHAFQEESIMSVDANYVSPEESYTALD